MIWNDGEGILLLLCWHSSIEISMPISSRDLKGTFHKTSIGVAIRERSKNSSFKEEVDREDQRDLSVPAIFQYIIA